MKKSATQRNRDWRRETEGVDTNESNKNSDPANMNLHGYKELPVLVSV